MVEDTELELLITVVVAANDDAAARAACDGLVRIIGGRILESCDCSDEEPGCWSVTISCGSEETCHYGTAGLSRALRRFLRELGPAYSKHRVSCEPPTAWTVVDNPELVGDLVAGGERMLVEAWLGGPMMPASGTGWVGELDPDEPVIDDVPQLSAVDENGKPRARLGMNIDVVTERAAGAAWPARAVASRIAQGAAITDSVERPPMVRVTLDLGPVTGTASEAVANAVAVLGGVGWSRQRMQHGRAFVRWAAAPTPPSGIAGIELFGIDPPPDGASTSPEAITGRQ